MLTLVVKSFDYDNAWFLGWKTEDGKLFGVVHSKMDNIDQVQLELNTVLDMASDGDYRVLATPNAYEYHEHLRKHSLMEDGRE